MESFEIQRTDKNIISVLYLKGFLDAHTAISFEEHLQTLVDEQRYHIVVNLQELTYISSAGLGVFMGFIEEIRSNSGDIKICSMNPRVYKVFDLLGFPSLYQIFTSEEDALAGFQKS